MTDRHPIASPGEGRSMRRSPEPKIAGVAGGLGAAVGIDPTIIRVAFVILALASGAGFLAYLGAWILMPTTVDDDGERSTIGLVIGGSLLALAATLALLTIGGIQPVAVVVFGQLFAGIAILNRRPGGRPAIAMAETAPSATDLTGGPAAPNPVMTPAPPSFVPPTPAPAPGVSPPPPAPVPPPAPSAPPTPAEQSPPTPAEQSPSTPAEQSPSTPVPPNPVAPELDVTTQMQVDVLADPSTTSFDFPPPAPPDEADGPPGPHHLRSHWAVTRTADETILAPPVATPPPPPDRRPLAAITVAALIALVGMSLVFNTIAGTFVGAVTVAGAGTAVVGLMMAISSFTGRSLSLVPLAALMLLILPATPSIDHAILDGTGATDISVASIQDLEPSYRLGVGELILDLSNVAIGEDTTVDVTLGTGSVEVVLPPDTVVDIRAESTVGYVWVLGEARAGLGTEVTVHPSSSNGSDSPRLTLNVSATIGGVDVSRARPPIGADG